VRLYCYDDYRIGVGTSDEGVADATHLLPADVAPRERMNALIAGWGALRDRVADLAAGRGSPLGGLRVRAPQPAPRTLLAAPVNYRRHQHEMGGEHGVYAGEQIKSIETYAGFVKASSSIIGPDAAIELPALDRRFDHEAEIAVVIGAGGRDIPRARAREHIFGYVPLLDITMRGAEDRSYRKSFDTFTPIGPAIVTVDEVRDDGDIDFELTVNGELRQRANSRDLIFDVPRLVELYSSAITLQPGDIIATGTPEGVGELRNGDEVVLTIDGIGCLTMPVVGRDRVAEEVSA
jgi:2-keto-4-pentenoate hydratase/2-oxohepta-3-ene-1,7-dioic acid hydratase in catechol pathway